jgi:hypothetical protein
MKKNMFKLSLTTLIALSTFSNSQTITNWTFRQVNFVNSGEMPSTGVFNKANVTSLFGAVNYGTNNTGTTEYDGITFTNSNSKSYFGQTSTNGSFDNIFATPESIADSGSARDLVGFIANAGGLQVGSSYRLQILINDFRTGAPLDGRYVVINDSMTVVYGVPTAMTILEAEFTATGNDTFKIQSFNSIANGGASNHVLMNAHTIHLIPEPSAALLGSFGLIVLLRRRR